MRKRILGLVAVLLITAGGIVSANPMDIKKIPSDAKWLIHLDAEQLLLSKLGDMIRESALIPEVKVKLEGLEAATSFNVLNDLRGITVWGKENPEKTAVVLAHGKFDKVKLTAIIKALDGFQEKSHGDYVYYTWVDNNDGGKQQFGGFIGEDTIFISPSEESAISLFNVVDGKSSSLAENQSMVKWNDAGKSFIVMGSVDGLGELHGVNPHAAILKNVTNAYITILESGEELVANIVLETEKEEVASQMREAGAGLKALAVMSAKNPVHKTLAESIEIKAIGKKVDVTVSCPISIIKDIFEKKKKEFMDGKSNIKVESF